MDLLNSILGLGAVRRYFGGNSGYVGYSKSKRAVAAEERGLRNKSQMDASFRDSVNTLIVQRGGSPVTLKAIKDATNKVVADEWHHTSMYGNKTDYYSAETIAAYFAGPSRQKIRENELKKQLALYRDKAGSIVMSQIPRKDINSNADYSIPFSKMAPGIIYTFIFPDGSRESKYYAHNGVLIRPAPGIELAQYSDTWDNDDVRAAKDEYNELKRKLSLTVPSNITSEIQRLIALIYN